MPTQFSKKQTKNALRARRGREGDTLKLDALATHLNRFDPKLNADGADVGQAEFVPEESRVEGSLAHTYWARTIEPESAPCAQPTPRL